MNRLRYTRYAAVLAMAALLTTSCESGFESLNTDPTQADEIQPDYLFTTIEVGTTGSGFVQWRSNLIFPNSMMQLMSNTWWSGDKYTAGNDGWRSAIWDVYYGGGGSYTAVVRMVQDLIATHRDDPQMVNKVAAARIMRAFIFHRLTDMYGDVPYFEAGKGFLEDIIHPTYTPQSEIYADMLKELEEAVASLDPAMPTYGASDVLYGPPASPEAWVESWRRFGNSLMLRLAMRLVKVDPAMAEQWAVKAINGRVMESNDDSAVLPHENTTSVGGTFDGIDDNPISSILYRSDNPMWSEAFVSWMQEHDDPRLSVLAGTYNMGANSANAVLLTDDPEELVGYPVGNSATTIQDHPAWNEDAGFSVFAQPKVPLRDLNDPTFYLSYAQTALLRAEAAARGWTGEDPAQWYEEGVRAAMEMLSAYDAGGATTIPAEEIDAYLAANPYDPANALEQINTQYWAVSSFDGMEAWANWRRSGYPVLDPVDWPGNVTSGQIPRRMPYPAEELVLNPESYQEAVSRQGLDGNLDFTTPVWWDVQ